MHSSVQSELYFFLKYEKLNIHTCSSNMCTIYVDLDMPSHVVQQDNVVLTLAIAFCCVNEILQSFLCAFGT